MATRTTLSSWAPYDAHVQPDVPDSGTFIDAKTTLIAAGPGRLSSIKASGPVGLSELDVAYPIGLIESFSINQTKTIQKIFELGSLLSYVVPGRTFGSAQFGRTMYQGRSLLNVLYASFNTSGGQPLDQLRTLAGSNPKLLSNIQKSPPGQGNFYINLGSVLFNHSFGVLMYMIDNNLIPYGACYMEDNYLQGHQLALNSQATVIVEGTSSQFDRCLPVTLPADQTALADAFI